jgi:hypothetical protein
VFRKSEGTGVAEGCGEHQVSIPAVVVTVCCLKINKRTADFPPQARPYTGGNSMKKALSWREMDEKAISNDTMMRIWEGKVQRGQNQVHLTVPDTQAGRMDLTPVTPAFLTDGTDSMLRGMSSIYATTTTTRRAFLWPQPQN